MLVTAPAPAWRAIEQPAPVFAVDAPELKTLSHRLEARRHENGGREDKLVVGVFESDAPYLRVALFRGGRDPATKPGFFIDLVRRAGEAGLGVLRSAQPFAVATKFGPIEVAEVVLADGLERSCLAFRIERGEAGFSGHGWLCGGPTGALEPAQLACVIDQLNLRPVKDEPGLEALFAAAGQQRTGTCGARPTDSKRKTA